MEKKVLVVDVDETLLNIEPLFFLRRFRKDYQDYNGKLTNFPGIGKEYYIVPRPRAMEFLTIASLNFELVAFSVVGREITARKLEVLGFKPFFKKIYGKEDLANKKKSLEAISKDLDVPVSDIVAIDDVPEIFESGIVIPVKPFFMGKHGKYEHEEHEDNLLGAISQALNISQGIKNPDHNKLQGIF